jgi:hypothetical protein
MGRVTSANIYRELHARGFAEERVFISAVWFVADATQRHSSYCPIYILCTEPRQGSQHKEGKKPQNYAYGRALVNMAVRVVEFSNGGYKIRKVFA